MIGVRVYLAAGTCSQWIEIPTFKLSFYVSPLLLTISTFVIYSNMDQYIASSLLSMGITTLKSVCCLSLCHKWARRDEELVECLSEWVNVNSARGVITRRHKLIRRKQNWIKTVLFQPAVIQSITAPHEKVCSCFH